MNEEELKIVLQSHKLWIDGQGGQRAELSGADMSGADLSGADLSGADLSGADLSCANLSCAILRGANMSCANMSDADMSGANMSDAILSDADMSGADLSGADMSGADMSDADLSGADLSGANMSDAILSGANLSDAKFNEGTAFFAICCPEKGSFVGFKKINDKIVELEIPDASRRSSATTRKCRCEFAKVLSITNLDGGDANIEKIVNNSYATTVYKVGEMIYPDKWDDDRWNECSHGIHFFITREEAVNY